MIQLYPFQQTAKQKVYDARLLYKRILLQLPTGAGKTVIAADIIREHNAPTVAIAHRQEIVTQISMALARENLRHRVIGPEAVIRSCRGQHLSELGNNYVDGTSALAVAGVDTLIRMGNTPWFNSVTMIFQDECHHQLKKNKWGKAYSLFPNAWLLGVTATPCRADGMGLGAHTDGFFETMITGPTGRELIEAGWLTDYKIYCPPSDLILNGIPISANGDYSPPKLSTAVHKSHIVGDVVKHYLKWSAGRRAIVFSVDVKAAVEQAATFRTAGVKAEVVSAKTPDALRASLLRQFRAGSIHVLCNVDLFGEGMDVPAVECVVMARPTASYALYAQQFGRALRILEGKPHAIIIDHVGNVQRHGLPDGFKVWSLDRRDRKSNNARSEIPIKTCPSCLAAYQALASSCPYCGYKPVPQSRSSVEFVDGDLFELSPDALSKLRGLVDRPITFPIGASREVVGYLKKVHRERQETVSELREVMAQWAGKYSQATDEDTVRQLQKRFYFTFGEDVLTAQSHNKADTLKLIERIKNENILL
jgi:superfamily II DNA or RNA helicase